MSNLSPNQMFVFVFLGLFFLITLFQNIAGYNG